MYTSSDSFYPIRVKAGAKPQPPINQPNLNIFGTASPKNYYAALSENMLTNGLFSRMMIIDVGKRPLCEQAKSIDDIPTDIMEIAKNWQDRKLLGKGIMNWENPRPIIAQYDGKAGEMMFKFQRATDEHHRTANEFDEVVKAVWTEQQRWAVNSIPSVG